MRPDEITYLTDYWGPKETQFIRLFTRNYPTLSAHSNQRSKSLYPGTKDILNKQLGLEEASRRLGRTIQSKLRQPIVEEAENGGKLPRTLDQRAFCTVGRYRLFLRYFEDTIHSLYLCPLHDSLQINERTLIPPLVGMR
jgi:hypothetical protein